MNERPPVSRFHDYLAQRQPTPTLADAAIALGVPVFPCDANKHPLTQHGHKDATTDPAAIRRMFQNPAAVMIGMPTGAVSGRVVIDVDVKDGRQGAAWLDANSHRMPQTRTARTGSGGIHIYLAHWGERVKNSQSKIAPGIDVRGDGGYVIVPPSPGYAIADDAPIAEAPDWLRPALVPPEPAAAPAPLFTPSARAEGGSALGREALGQRCDAIRFAYDGAKHAAVNEGGYAIGGLVATGHLPEGEAWAALRDALSVILPRCKDPRAAEKTLRRAFSEGMGRPQNVEPPEEERPLSPAVYNITQKMLARARKAAPAPQAAMAVSPDLMDVPGALRLFIDHCEQTAMSPQPFLALAAGICMVGALAGRRYRTTTDLRTNIYAVGVADSGAGKDHARKQILRCLYAANLPHYLGGSDVASGAGLRSAIQRHPSMLFQIDEFGDWLAGVLGEKASTHKKQIASMLKELYSSASGPWQGTEYADQSATGKPKLDIHQPNACLYGTTTPGQFWGAVAGANLHDGLLARMLLFVSPCSYPDERDPDLSDPSPDLITALQAIAAGPGSATNGAGNLGALMLASTAPEPMTVPETPEAAQSRRALRQDQLKQQRKHEGTYVTAIAGRLAENAMKLALVRAISRDPAAPIIQADDVAWGRALAQHCVDTLLREAAQNVGDTDYERKVNRALSYIRKHGPISAREMLLKGWRLPGKEREEILRTLVEGGLAIAIEHPPSPQGGRATIRYAVANETPIVGMPDDA